MVFFFVWLVVMFWARRRWRVAASDPAPFGCDGFCSA
jgi:hypothetical protein